jgi:hypothetical protein
MAGLSCTILEACVDGFTTRGDRGRRKASWRHERRAPRERTTRGTRLAASGLRRSRRSSPSAAANPLRESRSAPSWRGSPTRREELSVAPLALDRAASWLSGPVVDPRVGTQSSRGRPLTRRSMTSGGGHGSSVGMTSCGTGPRGRAVRPARAPVSLLTHGQIKLARRLWDATFRLL